MGRSQKWPDLRSPISKIRDIRFVGTGVLIIFRKFHNFPWNIVAVARLGSYFVVGSLDLTWWPDLTWHWVEIFTKVAEKMGGKVGENPAALRAAFFRYPRKTWGGRSNAPPEGRGLTFALLWGVWTPPPPPCGFSRITRKRRRAAPPCFHLPYPHLFDNFVKVSILGHARSGHQVRSSDHTLQNLYNRATATLFEGRLRNFLNMIRSSVPTKCISRIFDICDLRSGHFRDLPIISQWAKIKLPVLRFILSLYEWNRTM